MQILKLDGLCKQYPAFRLDNVSFSMEAGTIMGLIGRNGAGKTTTLKSMLHLVHPDAGQITICGLDMDTDERVIRSRIGFVSGGASYYQRKRLRELTNVTKDFYPDWDSERYARLVRQFSLDEVWMLPNGNPPHKRDHSKADVNMRLDMLRLAVKGLSYVKVCDLEQSKDAYHYTFQTLLTLNRMYPEVQFYFIMGADSLFDFEDWREPGIISQECILLAAARDHCRLEEIQQQIRMLKEKYDADIRILNTPDMEIASADIRGRIAGGEDISQMLPAEVEAYIRSHHLYEKG